VKKSWNLNPRVLHKPYLKQPSLNSMFGLRRLRLRVRSIAQRPLRQALDENSRHIGARSQLATLLLSRQQRDKAEHVLAEGLVTDSQ
jgi:hypothetical protein